MTPSDDPLDNTLDRALHTNLPSSVVQDDDFQYNYDRDIPVADSDSDSGYQQPDRRVFSPEWHACSFYDRHVASNLTLQRVICLPGFSRILSKGCDSSITEFLESKEQYSSEQYTEPLNIPSQMFTTARTVQTHYKFNVFRPCSLLSSKLIFHPEYKPWNCIFRFHASDDGNNFKEESCFAIEHGYEALFLIPQLDSHLSDDMKEKILNLARSYPTLALWHFYPMADLALTMFQSVTKDATFA
ncbi:hypothetical protein D9613_001499 [Agrocybe pediades]|uniref:Uncharacterized protein n=1 Tax=Agrocybe pediades TaxID=84607 RepID=A0A8H4R425_9AGAR|nr:hypothetical protein D9613_001499 [Agrocybe pediades]